MVRNGIKIGLVPFSQLPKLTLCIILILSFFIAMPAYSQCNMGDPKFGESRTRTEALLVKQLGSKPTERKAESTFWANGPNSTAMAIFTKDKFVAFMVVTLVNATADGAASMLALANGLEKLTLAAGFVFDKEYEDQDKTLEMAHREFYCKADRRLRTIITLGRDRERNIFSCDSLTYLEGDFK